MKGFFTFLLVSGLAAKFLDIWLGKSIKNRLTEKLTGIWLRIDSSSITSVSQAPLRVFSVILDTLLDDKVFTWKAFRRTALLSTTIMVVSLSVGGIFLNAPFAFRTPPWTSFDEQFKFFADYPNVFDQTIQNQKNLTPQVLELLNKQKNFVLAITRYNTVGYKIIYSVSTIILILLVSIVIYYVSFAISRMMVREAMEANTFRLMMSILFFSLCMGFIVEVISILLIWSAAYPLLVLCFRYLFVPLLFIRILNIILLIGLPTAIWFLGPFWIRIAAAVAILPIICLILVLFVSWLLFPFRKQIRYLLSRGLLRALEHEKGIFVFIYVSLSCIGGIAVAIAKLF